MDLIWNRLLLDEITLVKLETMGCIKLNISNKIDLKQVNYIYINKIIFDFENQIQ